MELPILVETQSFILTNEMGENQWRTFEADSDSSKFISVKLTNTWIINKYRGR